MTGPSGATGSSITGPTGSSLTEYTGYTGPTGPAGSLSGIVEYLNNSNSSDVSLFKQLSPTPDGHIQTTVATSVPNTGAETLLSQFVTDLNNPNTVIIPGGLWDMNLFASLDSVSGNTYIYCKVYSCDSAGASQVLLLTTGSVLVNSTSVIQYTSTGTLTDTAVAITTRIMVKIYATSTTNRTLTTYYEGSTNYSHIHTTLSVGLVGSTGPTGYTGPSVTGPTGTVLPTPSTGALLSSTGPSNSSLTWISPGFTGTMLLSSGPAALPIFGGGASCKLTGTGISLGAGVPGVFTYNTTVFNSNCTVNLGGSITVPSTGLYLLIGYVDFGSGSLTGSRGIKFNLNLSTDLQEIDLQASGDSATRIVNTAITRLAANDAVVMYAISSTVVNTGAGALAVYQLNI